MKIYVECVACIMRMLLDAIKLATNDEELQKKIYYVLLKELENEGQKKPIIEVFGNLYQIIKTMTGNNDPYREIKKKCNDLILQIEDELRFKISKLSNPLLGAIELAVAGNIIDYGIDGSFDVEKAIDKILLYEDKKIAQESQDLFSFSSFVEKLKQTDNLLFLSDNAGEIVLDKLFLEQIKIFKKNKIKITVATRSFPILNDVTKEEAIYCGVDKVADCIIETGSYFPGTFLSKVKVPEFVKKMKQADLIIAKGQGNFETMFNDPMLLNLAKSVGKPKLDMYFLFMAKCETLVRDINLSTNGCQLNDILLIEN